MMKHTIYIIISIITISCVTELKIIEPQSTLNGIDLRKYSDAGFLITPERFIGEYKSINIIDYVKKPGAKYLKVGRKLDINNSEPENLVYTDEMKWIIDNISLNDVLDDVYKICIEMGADALVNFKVELTDDVYSGITNTVIITGYHITGFAIKRNL